MRSKTKNITDLEIDNLLNELKKHDEVEITFYDEDGVGREDVTEIFFGSTESDEESDENYFEDEKSVDEFFAKEAQEEFVKHLKKIMHEDFILLDEKEIELVDLEDILLEVLAAYLDETILKYKERDDNHE